MSSKKVFNLTEDDIRTMTGRNIKRIKAGEMDPPEEVNNDFEEDAGGSGHMTEVQSLNCLRDSWEAVQKKT